MRSTLALALSLCGLAGCLRAPLPPPSPAEHQGLRGWKCPARPADDGSVRFFVLGDQGSGCAEQRAVAAGLPALLRQEGYAFAITVGDNFLPHGVDGVDDPQWETKYEAVYGGLGIPVLAALGNHDWDQPATPLWRYRGRSGTWNMPAPHYHFTVGEVLFVALDTTRWAPAQARWLARLLRRSRARWKIVYGHHPVHSYGMHGTAPALRAALEPLLRARADFYIAGHDHDKQLIERGPRPVWIVSGAGSCTRPVGHGPGSLFASANRGVVGFSITRDAATVRFFDEGGGIEFERSYRYGALRPWTSSDVAAADGPRSAAAP